MYQPASGMILRRWSAPVEGVDERPLRWDDFYTRVGRNDLADGWRNRRVTKIALIVTGSLVLAGGFIGIITQVVDNHAAFSRCLGMPHAGLCADTEGTDGYIAGGVLGGAGMITLFSGIILPSQPVPSWRTRELANEYNRGLYHRLGLDEEEERPPAQPKPPADVTYSLNGVAVRF